MKLYDPWVYCKWGVICGLLGLLPNLSLLGAMLFMFGLILEAIDRTTKDHRHD